MSDPILGQVINGKFRVLAPIGQGGMGKIYRAEQLALGRPVALKVLRQTAAVVENDPAFQRRFFLEASLCAKLSHPNIVTIYDYGQIENVPGEAYFLAMELLEGVTLNQRLRERGAMLPVGDALSLGLEIARGLREAHRHGIVHRDLKPGNVMLVPAEEGDEKVKIVDFGLVKQVEGDAKEDLTRENSCLGSPRYMSPEQVEQATVDHRSDLYSLGVMLYQCLCGWVPFEFDKSVLILMAHVSTPVPPMRERNPHCDVPPAVEAFVRKLLEKHPDARYATADEVIRQIRVLQHDVSGMTQPSQAPVPRASLGLPPVVALDPTVPENTAGTLVGATIHGRRVRRNKLVPILMGAGILALLGAAGGIALRGAKSHAGTGPMVSTAAAPNAAASGPAYESVAHSLRIESTPSGATVTENGQALGVTPVVVALEPSQHHVRQFVVALPGYESYTVAQGPTQENVRLLAALTPVPAAPSVVEPAAPAQVVLVAAPQPAPVVRRGARQGTSRSGSSSSGPPLDIRMER